MATSSSSLCPWNISIGTVLIESRVLSRMILVIAFGDCLRIMFPASPQLWFLLKAYEAYYCIQILLAAGARAEPVGK